MHLRIIYKNVRSGVPTFSFVAEGLNLTTLEEKLIENLNDIILKHNMVLDELKYLKKGREYVLQIYVEREDLSSIDLDEIVSLSEDLSLRLDEINLIQDNYCLDVSTSGAEKEIKDLRKLSSLIGKYLEIKLVNPIKGLNTYIGYLISADDERAVLEYKVKTRTMRVDIEISNIYKAKLTVKI